MAFSYCTVQEYYAFLGTPDLAESIDAAEVARLEAVLLRASSRVTRAARTGIYTIGTNALPTSERVREGFRDATAAQTQWFEEQGSVTGAGANEYDSIAMAGVSLSKRASVSAAQTPSESRIAPEANEYLVNAGIFSTRVRDPR